jgi:zinc protease
LISKNDSNLVIINFNTEKEGTVYPTKEAFLNAINTVRGEKLEAYVDNVKNEPLMATLPTAGKIVKEEEDKDLGTKTWTLSNGIKVISMKTDYREDQVLMSGYSKGGTSVYEDSELVNINMLNSAIGAGGVGNFTRNELSKALSGIQASANPSISLMYDNINGNCLPKDMETMFQLTYLAFTAPKRDDEGFKALMERQRISLENYDAEPMNAFIDQLRNTLYGNNPRVDRLKLEDLDKVNYDRIIEMYKDRMSDAGDFTFIFVGNFDEQKLRDYTELYLASLPATGRNENYVDRHVEYAKGVNENTFTRKMENAQTYIGLFQSGKCEYNLQNEINVSMIAQVMTMIYLEKIREEMGATYSVSTQGNLSKETKEFILQTVLPIKPETKDKVLECLNGTVENLGKNGIEAKYFDKVKEYLQKTYQENQRSNSYWSSIIKMKKEDGIDYKKDYLKTLNATTPEMLQKFVNDVILKQGNRTQVIMVPAE